MTLNLQTPGEVDRAASPGTNAAPAGFPAAGTAQTARQEDNRIGRSSASHDAGDCDQHHPLPGGPVLSFIAHGTPKPKGSMRHVGNGRMIEQVNGKTWHDSIIWAVVAAMPTPEPFTGPLHVEAVFTVRKPTSAPKRRRTWPITRSSGDLDKQLRRLFDAMGDAGAFGDDSQIVEVTAAKRYPLEGADALTYPGVAVRVYTVTEN